MQKMYLKGNLEIRFEQRVTRALKIAGVPRSANLVKTTGINNNLQMRTFKLNKFLLAGFLALAAFSCSGNVYFDPDKDHHTKKGFKTKTDRSFTDWLSMRFREGDYPSVGKEQAQTILAEADIKKINSRALGHISTFL